MATRGTTRRVGVMRLPNRCAYCNRFKPWGELLTEFVPDTSFSSEDESYRICRPCAKERSERRMLAAAPDLLAVTRNVAEGK